MADSLFGIAFQAERMALIQEIARNLVGTSPPAIEANPAGPASPVVETGAASGDGNAGPTDETLLADRLAAGQPKSSAAALLGMRPPQTTFDEFNAYPPALAQFARSEPATAVPIQGTAFSDTTAMADDISLPAAGLASLSTETTGETARAPAESIAPQADGEIVSSQALRREAPAPARSERAALADVTVASLETPDALESTEAVVERALMSLGLGEGVANAAAMRSELGGIIASFVLNAHFQPGWPPLRPVQDPEAKALVAQLAKDPKLSKDDLALLMYLANFGLNRTQLARILKLVASAANRSKLLQTIALVLANIGTLLGAIHAELEALAQELQEMRAGNSRRARLTLR